MSWVMNRAERKVVVETDSKLTSDAIIEKREYVTEVDHTIDQCKKFLQLVPEICVQHISNQANKVAHGVVQLPL